MIPHDDHVAVATLQPAALLLQHPSNEIQVRNGTKNKGPFLLNEWMQSLVLTFIHSFMFSIHSFTAACGCGQGDYTNACNILIHSVLLEDLMISSCSHVEVFPSCTRRKFAKRILALCLNNTRILSQWLSFFSLSQDPFIFMAAYFSCHKVKNTWVASSVCCLSALSMRQSFSRERDRDTDHALDQHSTLRCPSPHFISLVKGS